jgi:hypothetical protein
VAAGSSPLSDAELSTSIALPPINAFVLAPIPAFKSSF